MKLNRHAVLMAHYIKNQLKIIFRFSARITKSIFALFYMKSTTTEVVVYFSSELGVDKGD